MKYTRRDDGWQLTLSLGFAWGISFGRYRRHHYFFDLVHRGCACRR